MASIKDVAKEAGVSISTVSNVINGSRFVSEDLCVKVQHAIEKMDYEVDMVARSLKNNKTMQIGVILPSMDRIFIPQVLNGLQRTAEQYGYSLLIYTTNEDVVREKHYLKMLVNSKVDGIILDSVASVEDQKYYKSLLDISKGSKKIPVVSIERDLSAYGIPSVYADNELGAYTATKHLVECGCKYIVHISGPEKVEMVLHRTGGYKRALRDAGLVLGPDYLAKGDFSPLSGYRAMKQLFKDGIKVDGVFADNDQMAIGAIKAIREQGYKIPADIKLAGFDNTFVSSIVRPSLSTINVPKYRMGQEVARILCELMGDSEKSTENLSLELTTTLLVRESTEGSRIENWDLEGW